VERLARGLSYVDDERFDILILLFLPRERSGRWHRESVVGGDEHVRAGADDECVSVGADAGIDHRTVDGRRELREHEAEPEGGRSGGHRGQIVGDIDQFGVGVAANYSLHRGGVRRAEVGGERDHERSAVRRLS